MIAARRSDPTSATTASRAGMSSNGTDRYNSRVGFGTPSGRVFRTSRATRSSRSRSTDVRAPVYVLRQSHRGSRRLGASLQELHHLGARNDLAESLGEIDLAIAGSGR